MKQVNRISRTAGIIVFLFALAVPTFAQHEHHDMKNMKSMRPVPKDSVAHDDMDGMDMSEHSTMSMPMSSGYSPNLSMNRDGSGTSWLPDDAPMFMDMKHAKDWMFMFGGNIFLRYNKQDLGNKGSRGGDKVDAPNMLMAMGQRKIGDKGLFHFSAMFSLDAIIAGGSGYPLLFQTGETWKGNALVDRQHPHDLFSELAVSYSYSFSKKADAYLYLGYPGEPALGPVTFVHRPSGMFNPDAPISHHWADATHITFGVATLGFRYGKFKLEGSSFTGREPDENRYDLDQAKFDSRSVRLSFNPNSSWALQVSNGFIKSPEALHPDEDIYRTTASAIYSHPLGNNNFDATALWGQNKINGQDASNSLLLEAALHVKKSVLYARYEWVQKTGEELVLDPVFYDPGTLYSINAVTLGIGHELFGMGPLRLAIGGQLSVYHADSQLDNLYGKNPMAGEIYLHIYPGKM